MKFFWQRRKPTDSESRRPAGRDDDDSVYPRELERRERKAIEDRRAVAGLEPGDPQVPIGLACSGGGIRSATFCLGVFQALARSRLLRRVDFLSTVSGGGYVGTFLGHLYLRPYVDPGKDKGGQPSNRAAADGFVSGATAAERVSNILSDSHTKPLAFLRENGRYLSPNGSGDSLLAGAVVLRNWLAVQLVLITFCATVLFGFLALRTLVATAALAVFGADTPNASPNSFLGQFLSNFDPTVAHALWISDYSLLAAALVAVLAVPVGLAYWLTKPGDLVIAAVLGAIPLALLARARGLEAFLLCVAAYWILAAAFSSVVAQGGLKAKTEDARWKRGSRLSRLLMQALVAAGIVTAVAFIDSLGQNLHVHPAAWGAAKSLALLTTLLTFGKRVVPFISNFTRGGRPKVSVGLIAGASSIALVVILLAFLSQLTYDLNDAMSGSPRMLRDGWAVFWSARLAAAWGGLLGFAVLAVIVGHTLSFLNRSSLQTLYSARLTRAYLGASNPERWEGEGTSVTDPKPGDAVAWEDYHPERFGGPLHLINATINETVDGRSQVEQRDRKGVPLAVGPFGLSAGVRHHALWTGRAGAQATGRLTFKRTLSPLAPASGFRVFATAGAGDEIEVEPLTLGDWVGISGAAFSTGIGYRTSLGLSLLSGMANVRLGYWWNSGVDPAIRNLRTPPRLLHRIARLPLFPVQRLLLHELLARFPGTALKWWYLSDGGHFENTAAYELIRRRVPLIIILDNGADPDCLLEDMGSLVRKARLDFQTEIRFAGEEHDGGFLQIKRDYEGSVGTLAQLRPARPAEGKAGPPRASRHIAAAVVEYPATAAHPGQRGLLLLVKPTLLGNEPSDVLQYAANHPRFPQEPTTDQFFDEAQWESYRMLGEHIGGNLSALLESLSSAGSSSIGDIVVG
jgi:hypothetical protein